MMTNRLLVITKKKLEERQTFDLKSNKHDKQNLTKKAEENIKKKNIFHMFSFLLL